MHGLVNRGGLRKRDEQHHGEQRVPQAWQQLPHGLGAPAGLAQHFAVIRLGGVQQQQRVAGRRRIDDHELILTVRDGVGERAEDRDLYGAR